MDGAMREMTPEEKEIALKPWAELTDSQKIERLVNVLRSQQHMVNMFDQLQRDVTALKQHQHGANGQLMLPFQSTGGLGGANMLAKAPMANMYNRLW